VDAEGAMVEDVNWGLSPEWTRRDRPGPVELVGGREVEGMMTMEESVPLGEEV